MWINTILTQFILSIKYEAYYKINLRMVGKKKRVGIAPNHKPSRNKQRLFSVNTNPHAFSLRCVGVIADETWTLSSPLTSCEVRAVIRFLHAEGQSAAEIHRRLCRVYGDTVKSANCVRERCRKFRGGRADVHDVGGQGRHSIVTDELVQKVDQCARGKRRFTKSELYEKQPTDFHKTQRMGSALTFLKRYWEEGGEFLDRIVTGVETWVQFVNTEKKEQSKQWRMHTHSPNKPKKFKQTPLNKKLMATVFWDRKGILLTEFIAPGTTIPSEVYYDTLHKLWRSIQNDAGCSLKVSFSCMTTHVHTPQLAKCFNHALQLGDFRPPSLQSEPGAKRLPFLLQDEGLVGYPALPLQRRAHAWSQQQGAYLGGTVF
jgi:transposase